MRKLVVAVVLVLIAPVAVPAAATESCAGHEDGFLHLRISPAQNRYGAGETVTVNAEVVRRLPTGDVPVEGANVAVFLNSHGFLAWGRNATSDVDGQATLRIRPGRLRPGLADASGRARITYTELPHCLNPTHEDSVAREDFVRIVK